MISKKYSLKQVVVSHPPINRLPYIDSECINTLFHCLDVDNVLLFFKRVLLDSNNLMVSTDKKKLIQVGEALKSLAFPFKYEFTYVPYLPPSLIDFLGAPMPFLMGIESSLLKKAEDHINDGTYIIDLD
jgi:DENN (AEX-3) domain